MMKKLMFTLLLMAVTLSANAQFEKKKTYVSTSLSGLSLSYSDKEKTVFGLEAMGGYFIEDSWMLYGKLSYGHTNHTDDFSAGVGGRYYFTQNGIYLGAGLQYEHMTTNINNVQLCPEVGYAFFINHFLTIEPAVYYNMSLNDFAHGSKVGLKIGLGFYF
ncbi:MAG: autotransporter outer membrane beta-barrel domain-containing protein [Clostridium sp.]|nr:autotransporter outer membrane beta-barrel domain-containing protein [Clostridium sp.]